MIPVLAGLWEWFGIPDVEPGAESNLRWLGAPPLWVTLLVILPALAWFCSALYRRHVAPGGRARRGLLAGLRLAALVVLLLMLFEPILAVERLVERKSVVAILVDDSLSMSWVDRYRDPAERERLARAAGFVAADAPLSPEADERLRTISRWDLWRAVAAQCRPSLPERLAAQRHTVKTYTFGARLQRDADLAAPAAKPAGTHTKLGDALHDVLEDLKGQPLAAIVVVSDGRSNAGEHLPREAARAAAAREVPIYPVAVGSPELPPDVRIAQVEAADVVLLGEQWEVVFTVEQSGFPGESVRASLRREGPAGVEMAGETVVLPKDAPATRARLRASRFPGPGEYTCVLEIPPDPEDAVPENNVRLLRVRVVDAKLKILYVDGRPRFEYRHLSDALTRDRNVSVHVLLADADPGYRQRRSIEGGVESISAFPRTEKELFAYDVVILGDIAPDASRGLFADPDQQMAWLERFVEEWGGGLIFLAGPEANPARFRNTPLEALLPVELGDGTDSGFTDEEVFPLRTTLGRGHALLQLEPDPTHSGRNEDLWVGPPGVRLRGFYWTAPVGREKVGTEVFLRHPTAIPSGQAEGRALLASMWYGRGRTLLVGTDEVWRWRELQGDRFFYRFYSNAIRFVGHTRLLGEERRFQVALERTSYTLGDRVVVRARVLGPDYQPSRDAEVPIQHEAGDEPPETVTLERVPDREGTFEGSFVAGKLGPHRIWFPLTLGGSEKRAALTGFEVVVPERELADPALDSATLQDCWDESGASAATALAASQRAGTRRREAFFRLWELPEVAAAVPERSVIVSGVEAVHRLWDTWLALLCLIGLLCAEWIVRKMSRLP